MAEDKRISDLLTKTNPVVTNDRLVVYDSEEGSEGNRTKQISPTTVFSSPLPIGNVTPSTGKFTTLQLPDSGIINKYSNDETFLANSISSLVTERAIKAYIENTIDQDVKNLINKRHTSVICYDDGTSVQSIVFEAEGIPETVDSTSTYNFNSYDTTADAWLFPANMVDGDIGTFSRGPDSPGVYTQTLNANTVAIGSSDSISSVRVRLFGYYLAGATLSTFTLQPVFNGITLGDEIPITGIPIDPGGYSNWIDLTTATNAPAEWNWSDIANLDLIIQTTAVDLSYRVSIVEIEVTHIAQDPGGVEIFRVDYDGISFPTGSKISEFSNDGTLSSDSTSALVTEYAIKTYVDNKVVRGFESLPTSGADTTGVMIINIDQEDTDYTISGSIVNTTDANPTFYNWLVIEKSTDYFVVKFSASMDSGNYLFEWSIAR